MGGGGGGGEGREGTFIMQILLPSSTPLERKKKKKEVRTKRQNDPSPSTPNQKTNKNTCTPFPLKEKEEKRKKEIQLGGGGGGGGGGGPPTIAVDIIREHGWSKHPLLADLWLVFMSTLPHNVAGGWRADVAAPQPCLSDIAHKTAWTSGGVVPKVNYVQHQEMLTMGDQSSMVKLSCYCTSQQTAHPNKLPHKIASWRCVYKFVPVQKMSVAFSTTSFFFFFLCMYFISLIIQITLIVTSPLISWH